MTPQEALNKLDETVTGDLEWKIVLSKALEKQIPKKYISEKTDFFSFPVIKCPNCTGIIGKVEFLENCELVICPRGCPCCGQAIDNRSEVNDGK